VSKDRHHAVVAEFLAEVLVPTHVAGIEHQSRDSSILGQQLLEDGVIVPARPEVESQAGLGRRQELELGTHGIPLLVNTLMNATINTAAFASPTAKPHSHASGPAVFAKWPHAVPQSDPLPRGCGKTETARRTAKSEVRLDVDQTARQAATIDSALVLTRPHAQTGRRVAGRSRHLEGQQHRPGEADRPSVRERAIQPDPGGGVVRRVLVDGVEQHVDVDDLHALLPHGEAPDDLLVLEVRSHPSALSQRSAGLKPMRNVFVDPLPARPGASPRRMASLSASFRSGH